MSKELLTKRQPRRAVYPIHLDEERAQQRANLVGQAQSAAPILLLSGKADRVEALTIAVAEIDAQAEVLIHLVAVGMRRCEELMVSSPPTKEQVAAAKRLGRDAPTYDPDAVFPVLLSEAIERVVINGVDEGGLSADEISGILEADTWPNDQIQDLCSLALTLNNSPTARAVGNA